MKFLNSNSWFPRRVELVSLRETLRAHQRNIVESGRFHFGDCSLEISPEKFDGASLIVLVVRDKTLLSSVRTKVLSVLTNLSTVKEDDVDGHIYIQFLLPPA